MLLQDSQQIAAEVLDEGLLLENSASTETQRRLRVDSSRCCSSPPSPHSQASRPPSGAASLTKITPSTSAPLMSRTALRGIKAQSDYIFQGRRSPANGTRIINLLLIYLLTAQANAKSILLCTVVTQLQQKQTRSPLCRQMISAYISNSIEVMHN